MPTVPIQSQLRRMQTRAELREKLSVAEQALARVQKLFPYSDPTLTYHQRRVRDTARELSGVDQLELPV